MNNWKASGGNRSEEVWNGGWKASKNIAAARAPASRCHLGYFISRVFETGLQIRRRFSRQAEVTCRLWEVPACGQDVNVDNYEDVTPGERLLHSLSRPNDSNSLPLAASNLQLCFNRHLLNHRSSSFDSLNHRGPTAVAPFIHSRSPACESRHRMRNRHLIGNWIGISIIPKYILKIDRYALRIIA